MRVRQEPILLLGLMLNSCSSQFGAGQGASDSGPDGTLDAGGQDADEDAIIVVHKESGTQDGPFGDEASVPVDSGCPYQDSADHDGDGFSFAQGDCNDCDPNFNPGAYDYIDGLDEDCDGTPDNEPALCDTSVDLASTNPFDAAKSLGLCRQTIEGAQGKQRTWGVVSAAFVACDGSDICTSADAGACDSNASFARGHGNLASLGVNAPREGAHMVGLSTGSARGPMDPGYVDVQGFDKLYTCAFPSGYPVGIPSCPGVVTGPPHDCSALKLVLRVPTNATSFQFSENLFTYEFPDYVCSTYNDFFVALMTPSPAGLTNGNLTFDTHGNPLDVNTDLLRVCDPQAAGGHVYSCPLGAASLAGTGFGADTAGSNHGATGWLRTQVPIAAQKGGEITLTFGVWDSGDGTLDTTVLLDGFIWSQAPVSAVSTAAE